MIKNKISYLKSQWNVHLEPDEKALLHQEREQQEKGPLEKEQPEEDHTESQL